jgi:hypothetical protein
VPVEDGSASRRRGTGQGLAGGVTLGATPLVIGLAGREAQLGDRDTAQGGMQLPIAIRDRRWRSVLPELTGAGGHAGGIGDELGLAAVSGPPPGNASRFGPTE